MTKKDLTITIEEKILQNAKKHIPNLSAFFEECLKYHLGLIDGTYPTGKYHDIIDEIGRLQVQAFLINKEYDMESERLRIRKDEENKAWRFLLNSYRNNLDWDPVLMENAVKVLGVSEEVLEELMDCVIEDGFDGNDWNRVKEQYGDMS